MLTNVEPLQRRHILLLVCLLSSLALGTGCLNANDQVTPPMGSSDTGGLADVGVARDALSKPPPDTDPVDSALPDASVRDAATTDASASDASAPDAAEADTSAPTDAGTDLDLDAGSDQPDANITVDVGPTPDGDALADIGTPNPGTPDTGTPDTGTQPPPVTSTPPAFLSQSDTRAMWLWADSDTSKAFLDNRWGMQDGLMQLAAAPHGQSARALNRIFFEARTYSRVDIYDRLRPITYDPLLDAVEQAKLRAFNKRAHAQGVAVEYLDGQAIWLASDTNAAWPKQVCRDVVAFNMTTTDVTERLDGVHYDIEPHVVQGGPYAGVWWQNKLPNGYNADWTQRWKDIMNSCRATFDTYAAQTGHQLTLSVDLGADYAYYNKPVLNFFNGANTPVDYITLMNYYDNRPNQTGQPSFFYGWNDGFATTGGVVQNLGFWTNVPVLFGMETGPTGIAADYMSFYQEGHTAMYSVVDTLTNNYSGPGMLGVAFHPWGSFKDLQP
jgi:hypothetical protein